MVDIHTVLTRLRDRGWSVRIFSSSEGWDVEISKVLLAYKALEGRGKHAQLMEAVHSAVSDVKRQLRTISDQLPEMLVSIDSLFSE